jgi:hypothetical protein
MAVGVLVVPRLPDGDLDVLPRLEEASCKGQGSEGLPPRLDQVEVGGVLRLEDELPPGCAKLNILLEVGDQAVERPGGERES